MGFHPSSFSALVTFKAMACNSSPRSMAKLGGDDPSRAAEIRPCTSVTVVRCPVPMLYVPVVSMGAQPARTKASTTSST